MSTTRRSASRTSFHRREPGIEIVNRQRKYQIDGARAAELSRAVLDLVGEEQAVLNIVFLRDRRMRELNRDYRGIDRPTDVLSFAYREENEAPAAETGEPVHLGDLVISVETAERYARELGIGLAREIEHLVIHGTLHLAGYDHETDDGEMNRLEKRLRRRLLTPEA